MKNFENNELKIEMLRNPELRNSTNFNHPSGESTVNFNIEEVEINAETTWVTISSVPCVETVAATIVLT